MAEQNPAKDFRAILSKAAKFLSSFRKTINYLSIQKEEVMFSIAVFLLKPPSGRLGSIHWGICFFADEL